jgi:flagellar motor switch protein FliG
VARFDETGPSAHSTTSAKSPAPWDSLSDAETATIVEALTREHPQTVAVVVSRLEPAAAAKILSQLPGTLQADVLGRLAELDPADEHSVKVVESQLSQWITRQRERKQRLAAGLDLVSRILESTPPSERTVILTRLSGTNPDLAERINRPGPAVSPAPAPEKPAKIKQLFRPTDRYKPAPVIPPQPVIADPLGELEQLDDATLMATLTRADRHVVTLALAGASERLMKRVLGRLPRRQSKQFRISLRDIGPTRLSDMFAAQQELALCARRLQGQ